MKGTAAQLAGGNYKRAKAIRRNLIAAQKASEQAIWKTAVNDSSGPFSTAILKAAAKKRGAGLYSRRKPAPPAPPGIINQQSGNFKASWETKGFVLGDSLVIVLYNYSPEAKFMSGTSKMIPRPVLDLVQKAERHDFVRRYRDAVRKAIAP